MPLYEYECEKCGHRFEQIQKKFSDPPAETCPKCGSGPVHKLMSSPAIQFKGSGFYITDYGRKESGGAKSDGGSSTKTDSATSGGAASDSGTESKPDSKSDSKTETKPPTP